MECLFCCCMSSKEVFYSLNVQSDQLKPLNVMAFMLFLRSSFDIQYQKVTQVLLAVLQ